MMRSSFVYLKSVTLCDKNIIGLFTTVGVPSPLTQSCMGVRLTCLVKISVHGWSQLLKYSLTLLNVRGVELKIGLTRKE
jgi:hypothetical protein